MRSFTHKDLIECHRRHFVINIMLYFHQALEYNILSGSLLQVDAILDAAKKYVLDLIHSSTMPMGAIKMCAENEAKCT